MTARIGVVVAAPAIDRTHLVAELQPGTVHRPTSVLVQPGGKGFNVAHVARALGASVVAAAPLAGVSGRWLADAAAAAGIDCRPTWVPGELRTCLSVYSEADGSLTEFYELPQPIAPEDWARFVRDAVAAMEEVAAAAGGGRPCVALSGRLPPGAPDDGLAPIAAALLARGVFVAVDSDGPGLRGALTAAPALVKVNADEASAVTGRAVVDTAGALLAARDLRDAGAEAAVVTMGQVGAVAVDAGGRAWHVRPVPLTGAYPVGSGDAFLAGVVMAIAGGAPFPDALRLGAAAATANAEQPGAGTVDPAWIAALRPAIEVEPLVG